MEWLWAILSVFILISTVNSQDAADTGIVASLFYTRWSAAKLVSYKGTSNTIVRDNDGAYSSSYTIPPESNKHMWISLAMDVSNNSLYYMDVRSRSIGRINNFNIDLNDTYFAHEVTHEGISKTLGSLAFDWVSKNIYWTDGYFNWIGVQPAFTTDYTLYRAILQDAVTVPYAVQVDPVNGYVVWSDLRPSPRIERAGLDGTKRTTLATRDIAYPNAIALDISEKRIYWGDSVKGTLEVINYDTMDRHVIVNTGGYAFGSMIVYNNYLCYTEQYYGYVVCTDKVTGAEDWDAYQTGEPWGIAAYDQSLQSQQKDNCPAKKCSDICVNMVTEAKCLCREGFALQNDGKSCKAIHALTNKGILFINLTDACVLDIRAINTDKHTPQCIVANLTGAMYVQADSRRGIIYFWNSTSKLLTQYNLVSKILASVSTAKTGDLTSLFYDWINKALYWTESDTQTINMIDLQDDRKALRTVQKDVPNAQYLTANPHKYILYWISGKNASSMLVESSAMDGSKRKTIVQSSELDSPKGLYFSETNTRLFWINAEDIKSVTTNGSNTISTEYLNIGTATDLLLYKDYILWTSGQYDIYAASVFGTTAHMRINITHYNNITGMCIFDPRVQVMTKGPCEEANGKCQHICIPTDTGPRCECAFGFKLTSDQRTCDSEPYTDNFMLLADYSHSMIYQLPTHKAQVAMSDIRALNISKFVDPIGVAYDHTSRFLYWTELSTGRLRRGKLNGENVTTIKVFADHYPDRIVIDESTGSIYFTATKDPYNYYSSETSYIGVIRPVPDPLNPKFMKLVDDLDDPRSLALYPRKGYAFYGEGGYPSYIGRVSMDGSKQIELVSSGVSLPLGISVDYAADMVYWCDYTYDEIWRVDIEGTMPPEKIYSHKDSRMADMILYGNHLFYIGWDLRTVVKVDKASQKAVTFLPDVPYLGRIDNIGLYPGDKQPVSTFCSSPTDPKHNGRCSTFCLPTPGNRTCACEKGVSLTDGFNCDNVCSGKFPNGKIKDCTVFPGAECDYTCDAMYEKNPSVNTITCLSNTSWSVPEHQLCREKTCPLTINNGKFTGICKGHIGNTCTFTCNPNYKAYKYQLPVVTCYAHSDGSIRWTVDVASICESVTMCDENIPNGRQTCTKPSVGDECSYSCSKGFTPFSKYQKIVCMSNGQWNEDKDQICRASKPCSLSLPNGKFVSTCKGNTYEKCTFECEKGYQATFNEADVCLSTGSWSIPPDSLCIQPAKVSGTSESTSAITTVGAVLGVILVILIGIIVVGAVCYFTRRRQMKAAVYKNEPNVYFNNPPVDENSYNQFNQPEANQGRYHQFSNPMTESENAYDMISEKGASKPKDSGPATYYMRDVEEKKLDTSLKASSK